MALTVILADDHQVVRQGLRTVLSPEEGFKVLEETANGPDAVRLVERLRPQVLVLDLMLPGLNGLEVTKEIARRFPATKVVVFTMHAEVAYAAEALRAGAEGYVLKGEGSWELVKAVREAAEGRQFLSPAIPEEAVRLYTERAKSMAADTEPLQSLTLREREVFQLTGEGLTGSEIAERLFISPRTVETHRNNVMRKLGVRNQKELIRLAALRGIVPTSP